MVNKATYRFRSGFKGDELLTRIFHLDCIILTENINHAIFIMLYFVFFNRKIHCSFIGL